MVSISDLIGFAIGVVALVISIAAFMRTFEGRVRWEVERLEGVQYRLVNRSDRFTAVISEMGDADAELSDSSVIGFTTAYNDKLPITLEPGNGFPFMAHQFLGKPRVRVRVVWRQQVFNGRWLRPIRRTALLYV